MLKAVIFDMDGVLVDSEPLHHRAEREIMSSFGIELRLEELEAFTGQDVRSFLGQLITKYELPIAFEEFYNRHRIRLLHLYRKEVQPISGALNLIWHLRKEQIQLALASSSSREIIELVLRKFRLYAAFEVVLSGEDVQKGKPEPDIFLEAAQRLGCSVHECVVVEDSKNGVVAAKGAGMKCVGFISSSGLKQDLSKADITVNNLEALTYSQLSTLVRRG